MMGKLPKFKASKQSDPDRPGLLLHPRYLSRDSLSESILTELPHSSKLESRNPMVCVLKLPTRLHLATTLRIGALQVESPKYGVYSDFHR
jgi:hypothetical protein